jgi:hypothetical protein
MFSILILIFFEHRKFVPKKPNNVDDTFCGFVCFSNDKGLILYHTEVPRGRYKVYATIILFDFDSSTYEFISEPLQLYDVIGARNNNGIIFGNEVWMECVKWGCWYHIYVFKLNDSFTSIKSHYSLPIKRDYCYPHSINGKIVFANIIRYCFKRDSNGMQIRKRGLLMGDFAVLNDDYSLKNIENTSIFLESRNNCDKFSLHYVSFKLTKI